MGVRLGPRTKGQRTTAAAAVEEPARRGIIGPAKVLIKPVPEPAVLAPDPEVEALVAEASLTLEVEPAESRARARPLNPLAAAALETLRAAHDRTVAGIERFTVGFRHEESRGEELGSLTAAAVEALGAVAARELPVPRVDVRVESPDVHVHTPDVHPAAVHVDVQPPPPADVHVDVHPAQVNVPPTIVNVEAPPPAPARAMRAVPERDPETGQIIAVHHEPIPLEEAV